MVQRPKQRRVMRLESLQSRQLLAADLGGLASLDLDDGVLATASITGTSAFADPTVSASDAGSTRSTARDLGSVEDSVGLSGSLSYRDTLDVFRFELDRDGDVDLALSRMRRDADVFIADADGNILQRSSNPGRRNESLSRFLSEGTYYIGVQSRSFWGTGYRLELDVDLVTPEPPPPATPISPSVPGGQPVTPITPGSSNPSAPSGSIAPLNDVAYFGGSREWNLNLVAAPESWAAGYTGEGVTVAVIDTGVDLDHADLIDNLFINPGEIAGNGIDDDGNGYVDDVSGYDFASRDANPNDVGGHGTHVAGSIAAGNNGFGATGVAPDATILPVRVLGNNGSGRSSDVAAGIRYAVDLGADIINLSLGGGYSRAIDAAIDYAEALGVFVVAAAGNEAAAVPGYPARFSASNENVLSVGAIDQNTRLASFSNDVGGSGSVQLDAPGVGVFSTYVGGRYGSLSGTSMAAPQVAGVAALALSANPNLTPSQLRDLLTGGVTDVGIGSDATGIVNAATTVAYAAAGLTSAPASTTASSSSAGGRGNAQSVRAMNGAPALAVTPTSQSSTSASDNALANTDQAIVELLGVATKYRGTEPAEAAAVSSAAFEIALADGEPESSSSIDSAAESLSSIDEALT